MKLRGNVLKLISIAGVFVFIALALPVCVLALPCSNSDVGPKSYKCDGSFIGNASQSAVNTLELFGYSDWIFIQKDDIGGGLDTHIDVGLDATPDFESTCGSWSVTSDLSSLFDDIMIVLKASHEWAAYFYDEPINGGTWTTAALGRGKHDLSHLSLYARGDGSPAPVPEPATMILVGTGLVGLAGFRKKKPKS